MNSEVGPAPRNPGQVRRRTGRRCHLLRPVR